LFGSCPGLKTIAEPVPEPIICPNCGKEVEIFTNEQFMKCHFCGHLITRERLLSCLDWCKFADKCLEEFRKRQSSQ